MDVFDGLEDLWALRLKELAVRVVIFVGDAVLVHQVVVEQLAGRVYGEASAVGHSKSLRHLLLHQKLICLLVMVRFQDFTFIDFNLVMKSFIFRPDKVSTSNTSNLSGSTLDTLIPGSVFMCWFMILYAKAISLKVSAPVMITFPVLKMLAVTSFMSSAGLNLTLTAEYRSGSKDTLNTSE